jgi:serine/threonine-protein kinase
MQLGKYQLVRKLATGGMAEVYLAKAAGPMGFEKTLVLKRILPHLAEDPAFVEMFLGEAKLAAQLEHPNVVQIFDFGEAEGSYYLAMELIDGLNLRKLVKRAVEAPLPPALCAKLVASAAEGLAYAHEFCDPATGEPLGLIHRDVSPDNILVSRQGAVKVVDFGIAKVAGQSHKTQTGVVKGKVAYMPPEQLQAKSLDRRVDVYALGIVMYELLTGRRPFDATTDVSMMQAVLFEPFTPAVQRRPDLPVALQQVLEKALAKDRERRYPDCRALQQDLERFVMSTGEPVGAYQVSQLVTRMLAEGVGGTAAAPPPAASAPTVGSGPRSANKPASMVAPVEAPVDHTSPTTPMPISMQGMVQPPPPPPPDVAAPGPRATVQERTVRTPARGRTAVLPVDAGGLAKGSRAMPPPPMPFPERPTIPVPAKAEGDAEDGVHTGSSEFTAPRPVKRSGLRLVVPAVVGGVLLAAGLGAVLLRKGEPVRVESTAQPQPTEAVVAAPSSDAAQKTAVAQGGGVAEAAKAPSEAPVAPVVTPPDVVEKPAQEAAKPDGVAAAEKKPGASEPVAEGGREKASAPTAAPVRRNPPRPTTPRPVAVAAKGTLEFRIRPYAVVSLDGKVLGQTPLAAIEVSEGTHTLRLVNKELGKDVVESVVVKAGQPTIFKRNLEAE